MIDGAAPRRARVAGVLAAVVLVSGCLATQPDAVLSMEEPAGFLLGLWHGFISPIGFIVGIFTDARVYAVPNTGLWYDLGFMLGIGGFSSGIFASNQKKR